MAKKEEAPKEAKEKKPKAEGKPEGEKAPKGQKGEKKKGPVIVTATPEEEAAAGPPPPPRLRGHYQSVVRARLSKQFGFSNPHQVPKLEKIVLNVGAGDANKNPKL